MAGRQDRVVLITPLGDSAARKAASWAGAAVKADHTLRHARASEEELRKCVTGETIVCYAGHGSANSWDAFRKTKGLPRPVFVRNVLTEQQAGTLARTRVFALACLTARRLAPAAIAAGARRYIGFQEIISWTRVRATEEAIGFCMRDLIIASLSATVTRADLLAIIADHLSYWSDMEIRGSSEASAARAHLENVLKGLILL